MKLKNILFVLFFAVTSAIIAQPAVVKKADAAYKSGAYFDAAELLVTAYERISPRNERALAQKKELAYKAGHSFEKAFNYDKAAEWYQRAIDLKYYQDNPHVYFRIANIYRKEGEYDKARENYQEFLKLVPEDQQAENALASLEKAVVLKDNRTRYTIKNEFKINDEGIDMALVVAGRRGNEFVFASTRQAPVAGGTDPITGEGYFNLWQVEKDRSGNWTPPVIFDADSINTEHSEGTMAFDGRFRNAFITRCPTVKKKNLGCQIWVAEKRGRSWGIPTKVNVSPSDTISVGHPCPNEDGSKLIFAGDLPGGHGGMDLWYSEYDRRGESWSIPVNLGPDINTAGDELFPTFALNGDLLFSSTGHEGLGGLDIFRAEKVGEGMSFKEPKNMGTPLNSDLNDYHLTETGPREGFFTSNREGSKGNKNLADIWSYELPPNIFDLKVIVSEVGSPQRIDGATVQVTSETDGSVFKGVTNSDGVVFWDKKPDGDRYINEEMNYFVEVQAPEGYHESNEKERFSTIGLEYDQNFIVEMNLIPKTPIVLPEVRYALGSAKLLVEEGEINSKDSLNYVYELLQEYPGMVLKLVSHSDSRGSAKANEKLALERAQACVDYLVNEKGVNPKRLVPEGKGESEPRTVYKVGEDYVVNKPSSGDFETVELTESYINQFKKSNPELFEKLHQFNRRTEADVVRMDFTPEAEEENKENETEKEEGQE